LLFSITLILAINNLCSLFLYIRATNSNIFSSAILRFNAYLATIIVTINRNVLKVVYHITPSICPTYLISILVLIETISYIIKPITLCVRLSANIISGHILITLITNGEGVIIVVTNILFMIIELLVSLVQGYVFTILLNLYITS